MTSDERRIVFATLRWIRICHREGYLQKRNLLVPTDPDADHSSLLARLLKGEEPFAEPPPLSHAYPNVKLAEERGIPRDPRLGKGL